MSQVSELNTTKVDEDTMLQPLQFGFFVLTLYGGRCVAELVFHHETHLKTKNSSEFIFT